MKLNGVILLTDQGEIVENPDAVEFDTNKVSIKKKIFLLSNPLSNEN